MKEISRNTRFTKRPMDATECSSPQALADDLSAARLGPHRQLVARGVGEYARFLPDAAEKGGWFQGFREMVDQARRQRRAANGIPVHWHFAEREVADFVRQLFTDNNLGDIPVFFTPAH